jgi:threonine/homoserine/homoserine lactone efflux protein
MDVTAVLAFAGVAALLTITPGLDMALVSRSAFAGGRRAAFATTWGVVGGLLVWGAASAVGVATLLSASSHAYDALRFAGALYLIVLGIQTLRSGPERPATPSPIPNAVHGFRTGLVTNLANPKIAVFYSTVLPTFIPADADVLAWSLALAAIHATLSLAWLTSYAWLLTRARALFERPRVRRTLNRVTGTVLVAFGLRLAFARD